MSDLACVIVLDGVVRGSDEDSSKALGEKPLLNRLGPERCAGFLGARFATWVAREREGSLLLIVCFIQKRKLGGGFFK